MSWEEEDDMAEKFGENTLPRVVIYIDGACEPNPGPGGWAALLRFGVHERVISGYDPDTTNSRMELVAAIEALRNLKVACRVHLYTDSEYLQRGVTEWLPNWRKRLWRRKSGPLLNQDLWQALDAAMQPHHIEWHWIRGHAGQAENERVDCLAKQAIYKGKNFP